ncbi:hypothetical protein [Clostridium autoethanogenum]|uniref:DUF4433 domain-containing protein n=2 Tax=Clostridium autoethanogenum TaxID=84023 RepID=A0ABN4BJM4_9CLOT|nr:hypothetical protein [Clostridium autoethanogenum]AGY77963.1 DUF4433 domain-containing protein [Clostridium autoethanogenum DSM 10061]
MVYYHFTPIDNLPSILKSRTLVNKSNGVFVCDSFEDLCKFVTIYRNLNGYKLDDLAYISFETDMELEESFDHDKEFFNGARAYYSLDDIEMENICVSLFS